MEEILDIGFKIGKAVLMGGITGIIAYSKNLGKEKFNPEKATFIFAAGLIVGLVFEMGIQEDLGFGTKELATFTLATTLNNVWTAIKKNYWSG